MAGLESLSAPSSRNHERDEKLRRENPECEKPQRSIPGSLRSDKRPDSADEGPKTGNEPEGDENNVESSSTSPSIRKASRTMSQNASENPTAQTSRSDVCTT